MQKNCRNSAIGGTCTEEQWLLSGESAARLLDHLQLAVTESGTRQLAWSRTAQFSIQVQYSLSGFSPESRILEITVYFHCTKPSKFQKSTMKITCPVGSSEIFI